MFRKFFALVVMAAFIGGAVCFTGCSDSKNNSTSGKEEKEENSKVDHSSKKALVTSFANAVKDKDADAVWECFDKPTREMIEKEAKAGDQDLETFKKEFVEGMNKEMQKELKEKYNGDMDKLISDMIEKAGNQLVEIDGKWYISFAEDEEADQEKDGGEIDDDLDL